MKTAQKKTRKPKSLFRDKNLLCLLSKIGGGFTIALNPQKADIAFPYAQK